MTLGEQLLSPVRGWSFGAEEGDHLEPADRGRLITLARSNDETLDEVLAGHSSVAVVQYPFNANVGNHMMWLALTDYLRDRNIRVAYAAHAGNLQVDILRRRVGDHPIILLGGVTFSNLWSYHLDAKRTVATEFPDNRIVSLASTMLFSDEIDARDARDALGGHSDVVLLARDPVSAERARAVFGEAAHIRVQHDSAFRMGPVAPRPATVRDDVIWLRRTDAESTGDPTPPGETPFDWPWIGSEGWRVPYVIGRASGIASRSRSTSVPVISDLGNHGVNAGYLAMSRSLVRLGIQQLGRGRVLVTDRLHPHVLAVLLGMPVVLLPDRFGKNRAVYDHSTKEFSHVRWADDPATAFDIARELAAETGE